MAENHKGAQLKITNKFKTDIPGRKLRKLIVYRKFSNANFQRLSAEVRWSRNADGRIYHCYGRYEVGMKLRRQQTNPKELKQFSGQLGTFK